MAQLTEDVRYAIRAIMRNPAFSLIVVATLAVGISLNVAVFTLTSAFLFKGFPLVEENDRIVYISSQDSVCCVSYPDFEDWRDQAQSFDGLEVVHGFPIALSDDRGFPDSLDATEISAGTFKLIGQTPLMGRDFTSADEAPGAARVAILGYSFWETRYTRDPSIIGQNIRIDGAPTTVIGVMPQGFSFPQKQGLWLPIVPTAELRQRNLRNLWFAFGRLKDGVTVEAARAEMSTIGQRLTAEYPLTNGENSRPEVLTFNEFFIGANENALYGSMWGAVAFVLLIACANLANLLLARAIGRSREISVRIALGAGRRRIIRQLLTESVLLSILGGFAGWWLARVAIGLFEISVRDPGLSPWRVLDYSMDYRVLGYLTVISIGTGLLFGLAPARRLSKLDVNAALKDGGRSATNGERATYLSNLLVIGQVALAVVLLAGAGVLIRSFLNVSTAHPSIETENILAARLSLPQAGYATGTQQASFYDQLDTRLTALPEVESVAFTDALPTWGSVPLPYQLAGTPALEVGLRPRVSSLVISPNYFRTLGATLLGGRQFSETDRESAISAAIVNERLADQFWPGEDAIGQRLRLFGQSEPMWVTVVGTVSNIFQNDATRQSFDPVIYLPYGQRPRAGMWVLARTRVPPVTVAASFRRVVQGLDSDLPIRLGPFRLSERLADRYENRELYAAVFIIFAAIALLLASVGLYSVVAHSVNRRTQEIGIRMAIGATAHDILKLMFKHGLRPMGIGLFVGLGLSFIVTRVLQVELVDVSPADPIAYLTACAVLCVAATLGCWLPARRAMRVDPVVALRHD